MGGYRDAFINLAPLFESGEFGSVAVNLIHWSGPDQQEQSIPWTLVNDRGSALQFAGTLDVLVRPFAGGTYPGSAIQFATPLFSSNEYEGQRWIIDVSGDGFSGSGDRPILARDSAMAAGVEAINGLPIVTGSFSGFIENWYRDNIQSGDDSFVIVARGFEDVGRAVEEKLRRELTIPVTSNPSVDVPEPASVLGIALVGGVLASLKSRCTA